MKTHLMLIVAASLATLAACDKAKEPANTPKTGTPSSVTPTPSVMNQGAPIAPQTAAEQKKGEQPVQGQVDTTQPAQRKDFELKK